MTLYRRGIYTLGPGGFPVSDPMDAIRQQVAGRNEGARQFDESLSFREREAARQKATIDKAAEAATAQTNLAEDRAQARHLAERGWAEQGKVDRARAGDLTKIHRMMELDAKSQSGTDEPSMSLTPEEALKLGVPQGPYKPSMVNTLRGMVAKLSQGELAEESEKKTFYRTAFNELTDFFRKLDEGNAFTKADIMSLESKLSLLRTEHPNADAIIKEIMLKKLAQVKRTEFDPAYGKIVQQIEERTKETPLPLGAMQGLRELSRWRTDNRRDLKPEEARERAYMETHQQIMERYQNFGEDYLGLTPGERQRGVVDETNSLDAHIKKLLKEAEEQKAWEASGGKGPVLKKGDYIK